MKKSVRKSCQSQWRFCVEDILASCCYGWAWCVVMCGSVGEFATYLNTVGLSSLRINQTMCI